MTESDGENTERELPPRGKLLTTVSIFLAIGCVINFIVIPSDIAKSFGFAYQIAVGLSATVVGISAYGIWHQRQWGAYLYIGLTIVNQPFLLLMGWWNLGALLIPGLVVVALVFRWNKFQ